LVNNQFIDVNPARKFIDAIYRAAGLNAGIGFFACYLENILEYSLPLGALGKLLGNNLVWSKLESLFSYLHRVIKDDIETIKFTEVPK
jgi:hypothetical protein